MGFFRCVQERLKQACRGDRNFGREANKGDTTMTINDIYDDIEHDFGENGEVRPPKSRFTEEEVLTSEMRDQIDAFYDRIDFDLACEESRPNVW